MQWGRQNRTNGALIEGPKHQGRNFLNFRVTTHLVDDGPCKVVNGKEQVVLCSGWLKRLAGMGTERSHGFLCERGVVGLWKTRLLVQNAEQALRHAEKEIKRGCVVDKGDAGHVDALALVFFLFHDKDVAVEEILQLLVREVDAKLLQAVVL